jgi:hypothetical protein
MSKNMELFCGACNDSFQTGNWHCEETAAFCNPEIKALAGRYRELVHAAIETRGYYWNWSELSPLTEFLANHAQCPPLIAQDEYGDRYPCCGKQHTGECRV